MPIELTKRAERLDSTGVRRGPRVWALALLLALSLSLGVPSAPAATYTVTNTADSGAGSLRAALSSALAGDTITFDGSLAGSTITLATALPSNAGVTFANAGGITVSYAPTAAGTHPGLTFGPTATVSGDLPNVSLSSTSTVTLRGIYESSGLLTLERLSGTVSVSGKAAAYGLYSTGGVTITEGISGSLGAATSSGAAYGIYSSSGAITLGGLSGSLSATTNSGNAYGIYNSSGAISLGGLSGSLTASGTTAYGIYDLTKAVSITGGISGDITATGTTGAAAGLFVQTASGISITGGISGTITASNASGGVGVYGLNAPRAIDISGGISGDISATAGGTGNVFGINSSTYAFTLEGGLTSTGSIEATTHGVGTATAINGGAITFTNGGLAGTLTASTTGSGNAYGVNGQTLTIADGISGSITATTNTGRAAGLYTSTGALTVGGISGSISATSTDNTTGTMTAATYGIFSKGALSLGDISGSVSASGPRAFGIDTADSGASGIGNISGTVSATSAGPGYYSCGIGCIGMAAGISNTGIGSLTIGDITGGVSATSTGDEASGYRAYAAGLFSSAAGTLTTGNISGTVSALASGTGGNAYGVYSTGKLTTGTISGTISATASGDATAAAVVATSGSDMTISGTLSATNASPSGSAYAILNRSYDEDLDSWDDTSGVDNITLLSGAKLLGKVDLSGGADTMAFTSSNVTISGLLDGGNGIDTIALTNSGSFSGYSIANFERLTKSGSGSWALNQSLDLGTSGATTVSGGTLGVNATLTSPTVSVASGATLFGTGTIVGDVTSGGTVSPGSSGGTLTVTGNYTQSSGSTLSVALGNAGCSLLDVSGTALLNSGSGLSVAASLSPGYYSNGQSYTFLRAAGGITGSFDSLSLAGSTFLDITLAETATEYQLVLNRTGYTTGAGTRNGYNAAQALDLAAVSPTASMQNALALVDFTSSGKTASMLDQLGPAAYGAMSRVSLSSMRLFTNAANSQLLAAGQAKTNAPGWNLSLADFSGLAGGANASASASSAALGPSMAAGPLGLEPMNLLDTQGQNLYLVPIGTYTRQATGDDSTGYQGLTYGLTGGVLIPMDERFGMAVQLGYAHSALDFLNSSSTADIDHFVAGAFGMYAEGGYYGVANVQAGLAYSTMRRRVDFGTSTATATGHPVTYTLGAGVDVGRDYELRQGLWAGPVAGLQAARITSAAFTEVGADALNLSVAEDTAYSLKPTLGVRLYSKHEEESGASISTEFSLRWAHEFLDGSRDIRASFEGAPGISFTGLTDATDADAILLGAGVTYKPGGHFAYFTKYNGEISGEQHQAHSVMFGVNVAF